MPPQPIETSDKRLVLAALAVIALSAVYIQANYKAAFPQASIHLRYSRGQITAAAEGFLKERGWEAKHYRQLTIFESDDDARLYLERELGLEEANRLMAGPAPVWRWRARWFQPPRKEEFLVTLAPDGRLVGFRHVVDEEAPGAKLSLEEARRLAEAELRRRSPERHRLIEEKLEQRPARCDYSFTWEQEGFRARDATLRRDIRVQGSEVAAYTEYLHVPEQWRRDFAALRSKNELYTQIAQAFYVPLVLAALIVLVQAVRSHQVAWRPLMLLAAAAGALMIGNEWNGIFFFIDSMPTSSTYLESLVLGLLQGLGAGVGVFFYIILAAAAGAPLYRKMLPGMLSLPAALTRRGVCTREFFRASVAGYAFAAAHIAFVVAFYLIGRRFGVWSPQDVEYSNLLSTALPWISPLAISILAAAAEEFWFRLLAIPLLSRLVRWRWVTVVLPAMVWGFLHANYPQQPGYIRGIEVGLIGVAAGYLMLRFGILATLVWHYTVDAVLIGAFLLQSASWYFRLSGLLVAGAVMFPLAYSLWRYRRQGGFVVIEEQEPAAQDSVAPLPEPPVREAPLAPTWPRQRLYWVAAVLLAAGVLLAPVRFGDFIRIRIGRAQALEIARRYIAAGGGDPSSWRQVAEFDPNLDEAALEYLRRQGGVAWANRMLRERTATAFWRVRFFRPMQKEEWRVYVDPSGQVIRSDHLLGEDDPGARLAPDQALAIAEKHLAGRGIRLGDWRLVDASEQKRNHRTDHSFVWEDKVFQAGQARSRISLSVVGDEPSGFHRFLKLPEQWLRDFTRPRLQVYLVPALAGAVGLYLLVVFLRLLGRHQFRWRIYAGVGAAGAAVTLLSQLNRLPLLFSGYQTDRPLGDYTGEALLAMGLGVLLSGCAALLGVLALDAFLQWAQGNRRLPAPSAWRAAVMAAAGWGLSRVLGFVEQKIPGERYAAPLPDFSWAAQLAPGWALLAGALSMAFAVTVLAAVGGAVLSRVHSRGRIFGWLVVLAATLALARASNLWLWLYHFSAALLLPGLLYLIWRTCAADLLTLGLAVFWLQLLNEAWLSWSQPERWLAFNGAAAVAAALAATWVFARKLRDA